MASTTRTEEFVKLLPAITEEDSAVNEIVYFVDPDNGELNRAPVESTLVLEVVTKTDLSGGYLIQPLKRQKMEIPQNTSHSSQQTELLRQNSFSRAKEHELKIKLLEQQLKIGKESHEIHMEIAKLKRDILMQEALKFEHKHKIKRFHSGPI